MYCFLYKDYLRLYVDYMFINYMISKLFIRFIVFLIYFNFNIFYKKICVIVIFIFLLMKLKYVGRKLF